MFKSDIEDNRDVMINKLTSEGRLQIKPDELEYLFTETGIVPVLDGHRWPERKWDKFGQYELAYFQEQIDKRRFEECKRFAGLQKNIKETILSLNQLQQTYRAETGKDYAI